MMMSERSSSYDDEGSFPALHDRLVHAPSTTCTLQVPDSLNGSEPSTHKISLLHRLKTQRPQMCDIALSQLVLNKVKIHAVKTRHNLVDESVGIPKHGRLVYKEHV